jgi:hypothetical protein
LNLWQKDFSTIGRFGYLVGFALASSAFAVAAPEKLPASHILITEEEARLPPPKRGSLIDRRGVTRSPRVELILESEQLHSPIHLNLKFTAFGGSKIDTASVKVTYDKSPPVDLTPRLKEFVAPTGIEMPDAELPVGDHVIRVELKDSDGRLGVASFTLKIEQ